MQSDWRDCTLGDFVRLQRGHDLTANEQRPGLVPVMGSAGPNGTHSEARAKGPGVVVGRSGASIGRVHYSAVDFWPHNTCLYVTDFLGNNPRFAYYLLQTLDLAGYNSGSAQPSLNRNYVYGMKIRVPGRDEQDRIVELLRAIDDRIDLLRQTNATLESIAQALFKSWFIDFDPVRAKAEGREPEGMDAAAAALFPAEFEESALGLIPKGWTVERLGALLSELFTGRRPKGGVAGFTEGVPSIGAESIQGIGVFDYGKVKYVPNEFFASMRSGKPEDFDILLYKDGGKPGHFMPRMGMFGCGFPFATYCINEHVFGIRCSERLGQPYGYFWIKQERILDVLRGLGNKAAIPGINRGDVEGLPVLVPHQRLVEVFNAATLPLIKRILTNSTQASRLGELRDTLLPRLISGKLRIPEAQAQVEEVIA